MYVQVVRGSPHRADRLRQEWAALRADSEASVAGLTATGEWIAALRHGGPDTRPGDVLPAAVSACFPLPPEVVGSPDAHLVLAGTPAPGAAFIQVMRARVADRAGWAAADADAVPRFAAARPDFLGSLRVWGADLLTVVDSFSSEAAARAGEAVVPEPADQAAYVRWFSYLTEVSWHDLVELW